MSLKRSISEVFYPQQVALDLRNQDPEAKRARIVDPNNVIDLSRSQSMEVPTSLPSQKEKSTTEAPATPEREASEPQPPSAPRKDHTRKGPVVWDEFAKTPEEEGAVNWDEFAKTHTPKEVLKAYSQRYTMVDHVLQTENVGNDVVVTGVKEVIRNDVVVTGVKEVIPVPMIPFTQVDEPVEDDEDELMTQPFEQTQAVEETQVEDTQPQIEATQPLDQIEETVPFTQVEETVPFDDPEPVIAAEQQVETTQQLETIPDEAEWARSQVKQPVVQLHRGQVHGFCVFPAE